MNDSNGGREAQTVQAILASKCQSDRTDIHGIPRGGLPRAGMHGRFQSSKHRFEDDPAAPLGHPTLRTIHIRENLRTDDSPGQGKGKQGVPFASGGPH